VWKRTCATKKVGAKKRDALMQKIPLLLTVGDREVQAGTVAVARRPTAASPHGDNLGTMPVADLSSS